MADGAAANRAENSMMAGVMAGDTADDRAPPAPGERRADDEQRREHDLQRQDDQRGPTAAPP